MEEEKTKLTSKLQKMEVTENMLLLQLCILNKKHQTLIKLAENIKNGPDVYAKDLIDETTTSEQTQKANQDSELNDYFIENEFKLLKESAHHKDIAISKLESELSSIKEQTGTDHSERAAFDQKLKALCERLQKKNDELGQMDENKQLDIMLAENRCVKNEINDTLFKIDEAKMRHNELQDDLKNSIFAYEYLQQQVKDAQVKLDLLDKAVEDKKAKK